MIVMSFRVVYPLTYTSMAESMPSLSCVYLTKILGNIFIEDELSQCKRYIKRKV